MGNLELFESTMNRIAWPGFPPTCDDVYSGPYFFLEIHNQPWYMTCVWFAVIIGGNFAIAWLLGKLQNLTNPSKTNGD